MKKWLCALLVPALLTAAAPWAARVPRAAVEAGQGIRAVAPTMVPPLAAVRTQAVLQTSAPVLSAASAVLIEQDTGMVLFEKDAHTPRPMASTTKIMTALLALESGGLDDDITVPAAALPVEGSSLGLCAGDHITMRDLVTGLLLASGNDAANTIAYVLAGSLPAFAQRMNARAAALGMKDTLFVTPSGLDADGHASSAYDMALLAAAALRNPDFAAIVKLQTAVISFGNPPRAITVKNHNRLLSLYPYAVGVKTGFTTGAGRCLVSAATKDGVTLIAVTLKAPDDWDDHIALYNMGFPLVKRVPVPAPELGTLPVAGGARDAVTLIYSPPSDTVVRTDENDPITVDIRLPRFAWAPVNEGDAVGQAVYYRGDTVWLTVPIMAAQTVAALPAAGWGERFIRLLGSVLAALAG